MNAPAISARRRPGAVSAAVAGALMMLAACQPASFRPFSDPADRTHAINIAELSSSSRDLRAYYERIQRNYLAQGLLRIDGGGPDAPFTQRELVNNFIRIALFEEFKTVDGRLVRRESATQLRRWNRPLRMHVHFGDSVPLRVREQDSQSIADYARRLSALMRLPITLTPVDANYHVFILNEDERRRIGPELLEISPDVNTAAVMTVQNMRRSTLCLVFAIDSNENGIYSHAVAIIRAEHPDLLRLSCIHEELAQGLGLPNDSPAARPSVFNDDEEFGLLTSHDELLLRMLYDPRMRPGMTAAEARPVAEVIAAELMASDS